MMTVDHTIVRTMRLLWEDEPKISVASYNIEWFLLVLRVIRGHARFVLLSRGTYFMFHFRRSLILFLRSFLFFHRLGKVTEVGRRHATTVAD